MPDYSGQLLGNYRLTQLLGRGGFAEVYLGEHRYLKSYAALKVLRASLTSEETQRFLAEARTLARLAHPNIVRVLDFGVQQGTPYLVMDYAPGGTLRTHYQSGARLPLETVVSYVKQVAAALQFAHNHSIIHRDIKPENMLLATEHHILLSDFGLALFAPSPELLSTQAMAGTVPYTAPEQLRGKPSFASDQYALGIVTYEWLCGVRPFEGNYWEVIQKHLSGAPRPLRELSPELSAEIEAVVLRALAKDPHQRYPSIQNFARALEYACREQVFDEEDTQITQALKPVLRSSAEAAASAVSGARPLQRIFLSHAPADAAFARRLQSDLGKRGVLLSNDYTFGEAQETDQENRLRQAIRAAHLVLVVVSPQTRSSRTVKEQMRIAAMYQRRIVFVWTSGENVAPMLFDAPGQTPIEVIDAHQERYEKALGEILDCLREEALDLVPPENTISTLREPRNPYKGLRAFTRDDARDFFGRGRLIDDLTGKVQTMLTERPRTLGSRLLTVIGPSGSGKSSVIMAGLLPRLQQGAIQSSDQWIYLDPMTPGTRPCERLAFVLSKHIQRRSVRTIREDLEDESERGLHLLAMYLARKPGTRVVVTVDQFEEVFSPAISERERQHFIDLLTTAVTEPAGPVVVLLTLRADFYDRPMQYVELGRLIEAHHVPVLPMDLQDLRSVIEEPAMLPDTQLYFEGNLVGDLLFEAQGQVGALPLLEFTLDQLFQLREGNWLTLAAYQQIGGVRGALVRQAEAVYASLPTPQYRMLARSLFLRLISPGLTEQDATRRRASLAELAMPDEKQTTMIGAIADAFVAARLLMANEHDGEKTIEVSHEALIREWPRLFSWLREAREDIIIQRTINADTTEWLRRGRPVDHLYRGSKLMEARLWAGRNTPNRDEDEFLRASIAEHGRQEREELNRQAREISLQRRVVQRQRLLVTALSIFSLIAIILASLAGLSYRNANQQRALAAQEALQNASRALAVESDLALTRDNNLDLALLLGVEATRMDNTSEARASLLSALEASPHIVTMLRGEIHAVTVLAFGPNGQSLFSSDTMSIYKWTRQTRNGKILTLKNIQRDAAYIGSVAFSPDGQTMGVSNVNGIWLQTGNQSVLLSGKLSIPANVVPTTTITFSSDGALVASSRCSQYSPGANANQGYSCNATTISIWNVRTTQVAGPTITVNEDVNSIALSPDDTKLATGSHNAGIQIWNIATGQALTASLTGSTGTNSIAFSPDSTKLAGASDDKTLHLWDVATGQVIHLPFTGHTGPVLSIAFSPNGKILASGGADNMVHLWDASTGQEIDNKPFVGHKEPVTSIAFSPDGNMLASGSQDGIVLLWNIDAEDTINQRLADTVGIRSPLFSPDGKIIFTGTGDGRILLSDASTGKQFGTLYDKHYSASNPQNSGIQGLGISGDGKLLVAGRADGVILLWDLGLKKVISSFKYPGSLQKIALSSDGHTLAAGGASGILILWDVIKKAETYKFHVSVPPFVLSLPLALSSDGKMLAAGNCHQLLSTGECKQPQVLLWKLETNKPVPQIVSGYQDPINDVAFSPDMSILASSSVEGIKLWNIAARPPSATTLAVKEDSSTPIDYYGKLLFSRDGKLLASYSAINTLPFAFVLWDVAGQQLYTHPFIEEGASSGSLAFSPDSQRLVSVFARTNRGVFLLWDIAIPLWQQRACTIANRALTPVEWSLYVNNGTQSTGICPNPPAAV